MEKKSALSVRQQFGAILDAMDKGAEPIVIEKNNCPVAVLISFELFQERFIELQSQQERMDLFDRFKKAIKPSRQSTLNTIRNLRYGDPL